MKTLSKNKNQHQNTVVHVQTAWVCVVVGGALLLLAVVLHASWLFVRILHADSISSAAAEYPSVETVNREELATVIRLIDIRRQTFNEMVADSLLPKDR